MITITNDSFTESPTHTLWAAVLLRGMKDAVDTSEPKIQAEALEWINSDSFEVGSFLWIVEHLFDEGKNIIHQIRNFLDTIKTDVNLVYVWTHTF